MRCSVVRSAFTASLLLSNVSLTACVTGGSHSTSSDSAADASESGDGEANVPTPKQDAVAPGPVTDVDLKEIIYQGAEKQLLASETETERVEIGDFESFKFTITKLMHNGEDVTNLSNEPSDRMAVELSGWYKRSPKSDEEDGNNDQCFSFDATAHLNADGDSWSYDDNEPLSFVRQNSEDCY